MLGKKGAGYSFDGSTLQLNSIVRLIGLCMGWGHAKLIFVLLKWWYFKNGPSLPECLALPTNLSSPTLCSSGD